MNQRLQRTVDPTRLVKTAVSRAAQAVLLGGLGLVGAAHAQTTASGTKTEVQGDSIVVTGIRAALESALNKKRDDNGIVDVIKAEDIAKFPDSNLAESLQRIPGVVIDRDAGEGRNITVRGLGSDFTRVRINGIEALATTGGTDSSGGANRSRGFDFNVFASELFNSLTVRKSASADVDEGSLGATVDLQTARPFDFKKRTTSLSLQGRYNDLIDKTNPRMAFLFSDTNADRTFGILFSAAYSKRQLHEEGFSTVRWDNGASSGGFCSPLGAATPNPSTSSGTPAVITPNTATHCGPVAQGAARVDGVANPGYITAYNEASKTTNFHPRLPRYGRLTHDQDRLGVTGSLQLRPFDGGLLTLDLMYAKLEATRQEDFLQAMSFSRTLGQGGKPQVSVLETQYGANGALLYGKYDNVDIRSESRYDELSTEFTQPTLTFELDLSPSVKSTVRMGRAESKFRNPVQTTTTLDALNVKGYSIDFRGNDRLPLINYGTLDPTSATGGLSLVGVPRVSSGTQPSTVTNTTTSEIRIRPQGATNVNDTASFNIDWDAIPGKLQIKAGLDHKRVSFDTYEFRRVNANDTIFAPTSMAGLTTTVNGLGSGLGLPAGSVTGWVIPDLNAIASAYDIYCNCIKSGPAGGPGDFTLSSITNGNARGNNRSVLEEDNGSFVMADFNTSVFGLKVRGNGGFRYVTTDMTATGYQATGGGTQVVVKNNYHDFLPSANVAVTLGRDIVLRAAAAKVMARPQLGNLNPGGTISTTGTLSVTSGNPFLKPFRATTVDGSFEWYFGKNAFLGVGLFWKDIDTYIQSLRTNIPYNQTGLPMSLLPSNFTGDEVFQVTTPINTEGGKLKGVEINYQQPFTFLPGIGKNFGMLLNYTYVQSKINYQVSPTSAAVITDDLLNLSPRSANASFYYDDGKFSARVSAAKRSAYLTRVPGQNNNDVEGKNGTLNVDASMSYKLREGLEISLEGVNLNNDANDQFISRARNSSVVYHVTGREFLAGVRMKF